METSQHSKDDELWTVYVDDLWSIALPHLREKGVYIRHLIFKKGHFPQIDLIKCLPSISHHFVFYMKSYY